MTYLEKYRELHPEMANVSDVALTDALMCPDMELQQSGLRCPQIECAKCWHMEMES